MHKPKSILLAAFLIASFGILPTATSQEVNTIEETTERDTILPGEVIYKGNGSFGKEIDMDRALGKCLFLQFFALG